MSNKIVKLFQEAYKMGWTQKQEFIITMVFDPYFNNCRNLGYYQFIFSDGYAFENGFNGEEAVNDR